MTRKVKCYWCGEVDYPDEMIKGIYPRGYLHTHCIEPYKEDKENKRKEIEGKTKLAEKIAEVYQLNSIQDIPHQFYPYIQDVRNDSQLFGKLRKNYKNGIPYEGIALTYEYCKEKIREVKRVKEFDNFLSELRYGLAIVRNNVVNARNDYARKVRAEKSLGKTKESEVGVVVENSSNSYTRKKYERDISDFLDEE